MDKKSFYYRERVEQTDLNTVQDNIENSIEDISQDLNMYGIWNWQSPSVTISTWNLILGTFVARDSTGKKLIISLADSDRTINMLPYKPVSSSVWVSVILSYNRSQETPRIDGNGSVVYFDQVDSRTISVLTGTSTTKPTISSSEIELVSFHILSTDVALGTPDYSTVRYRQFIDFYGAPNTNIVPNLNATYIGGYTASQVREAAFDMGLILSKV